MDLKTFKEFLHGFFQEKTENFADHYFRNINKDKNGKINFREFLLYLSVEGSTSTYDRIKWFFGLFDIDGNGSIDREEMVEMFKVSIKNMQQPRLLLFIILYRKIPYRQTKT
jgi:Ca2+-binding EF-hand superfamily protein